MRALIYTIALSLPIGLAACNAEPEQSEAVEDLQEDVQGPIQEELDQELTGAFTDYDTDDDMLLSEEEYGVGIGDDQFGVYDTDADGYLSEDEYTVYEEGAMDM